VRLVHAPTLGEVKIRHQGIWNMNGTTQTYRLRKSTMKYNTVKKLLQIYEITQIECRIC
jgi:hypothetical protein